MRCVKNSAYAGFEREIIKDRVIAGIKAKREKTGTWGRKVLDQTIQSKIKELIAAGTSIWDTAKQDQVSTRTVRKYK
jgi:DNA invertase Pin-like site-specific DNA recombinase